MILRQQFHAVKFAATLRRSLMAEHLGVEEKDERLVDPLACFDEFWVPTSQANFAIFSGMTVCPSPHRGLP